MPVGNPVIENTETHFFHLTNMTNGMKLSKHTLANGAFVSSLELPSSLTTFTTSYQSLTYDSGSNDLFVSYSLSATPYGANLLYCVLRMSVSTSVINW